MSEVYFTMNDKELKRLRIIERLDEGQLKQKRASDILDLSTRQIRNLLRDFRKNGSGCFVSKRRGYSSNRAYKNEFKNQIITIIREQYSDFGPTLAKEYLAERHNITIGIETLRQWMISANLWFPKKAKKQTSHPPRTRRPCYGELIQIDGSPHDWFEGRAPECTLLVFIDDATSQIQLLEFVEAETTFAYFSAMKKYIATHGKPFALYSDKHGVFKVNAKEPERGTGLTQFGRAMHELDIQLIHANSPQAKGRVERANGTLQDRLVKWLRIEKISSMEEANQKIKIFLDAFNQKFSVVAKSCDNVHEPIKDLKQLDLCFTIQAQRKVNKNLCLQYHNKIYYIEIPGKGYRLRQASVTVCESHTGEITLLHKEQSLNYRVYDKKQHYSEAVSAKELPLKLRRASSHKPTSDHPWNQAARQSRTLKQQRTA